MKTCSTCKEEKEFSQFSVDKNRKDGLQSSCKSCKKEYLINWKKTNQRIYIYINCKEKQKIYYENNKEKIKIRRKQYLLDNREKTNENYRKKRQTNPLFKLRDNTSSLIRSQIKKQGYKKRTKTANILGCSFEEFKSHLEKQFTNGMSWENQGQWHLDHIYPVSLARDEQHLIELNHYTNFQPLWAVDNIRKGNKIIEKQLFLL